MDSVKNSILRAARKAALSGAAAYALAAWVTACSSAPIKMECKELQARIDYSDLSADQLRFAKQELDDCLGRVKAAEEKDSAFVDGAHERFTPADSTSP